MHNNKLKVACVIPTYNGKEELERLLDSLAIQQYEFNTIVVDSSSNDGTFEVAKERIENVISIKSADFNHGGTRQMVIEKYPDYDVYVYVTQDAFMSTENAISQIIFPFSDPSIGAVCGRQIPHVDATIFASHARYFNYPDCGLKVNSFDDKDKLGIKCVFISNSFAAYKREAVLQAGGFPSNVILSEDMYLAAKMMKQGWKIAYQSNAVCNHSHNYSVCQEFKRYFDIGVFHAREPWIQDEFGGAEGEGLKFILSEFRFVGIMKIYLYPIITYRTFSKLLGYKLGKLERFIPICIKNKLSMNVNYWV